MVFLNNMDKKDNKSDPKNEVSSWIFQCIAALSASLATFTTGSVLGWPSQITDDLLGNQLDFPIDSDELGWVYSSSSLGAALLSLLIGSICDGIGRKMTMLLMIIPMEVGWLLIILSGNVWMLIFGRILTGMVGGAYCVTVSLYIDEISQKEIRGILGGLTQCMISCGILFSNIVGDLLTVRHFSIACAVLPVVFGVIFALMPETPVFLLMKGRPEVSKNSLKTLRGKTNVDGEFGEIQRSLQREAQTVSLKEIFRQRAVKKACLIGVGLALIKVLSGIDAITSYLSHIFGNTNTVMGPQIASILFATFQVLSIIPQALVVDRWGRKILLILSQFCMAVCLFATALSFALKGDNLTQVLEYIPLVALCLYTVSFSIGIGPIGWIISAEIFEEKIKGRAMSVCTFLVWFLAFGNVKLYGVIETGWDASVPFFLYSCASLLGAFFVLFLVPETKNKTFEEIEKALSI